MAAPFNHLPIGPWPRGIVNTVRDTALPGDALADAVNVNIRRDGSVVTRPSWEIVLAGDAHSFFRHGDRAYAVVDNELCELDSTGATPLMAGVGRVSWTALMGQPAFATSSAVYTIDGNSVVEVSGVGVDEFDLEDELIPMPGGQWVEYWNGRLVVARGTSILFSEPLRYGAHNPVTGYIRMPSRIEWMVALEQGIYVGLRDTVVFLQGTSLGELSRTIVAKHSAPGMGIAISGEHLSQELANTQRVAVFFTSSGFTLGLPSGRVVYPQNGTVRNLPLFRGRLFESGGRIYAVRGY